MEMSRNRIIPYRIILLLLSLISFISTQAPEKTETVMLVELNRHGARAPITKLTDVIQVEWLQKTQRGELTPVGERQRYLLGKNLFYKYPGLFKDGLSKDEYYVRSTYYNRTIASAFSQIMGIMNGSTHAFTNHSLVFGNEDDRLKPPQPLLFNISQEIDFDTPVKKGFVPFPIHSELGKADLLLQTDYVSCPNNAEDVDQLFKELGTELLGNENMTSIIEEAIKVYGIEKETKDWERNFDLCYNFGDFVIQDYLNNPNPRIKQDSHLYKKLSRCYFLGISGYSMPESVYKSSQSELLKQIISYFQKKISSFGGNGYNYTAKYMQFSAHDDTLAGHLNYLGVLNFTCLLNQVKLGKDLSCIETSPVASNIIWELLEIKTSQNEKNQEKLQKKISKKEEKNNYGVRVSYNGKYLNYCKKDNPELEDFVCEFDEFVKIVQGEMIVDDITGHCGLNTNEGIVVDEKLSFLIAFILLVFNLTVLAAISDKRNQIKLVEGFQASTLGSLKRPGYGTATDEGEYGAMN